MAVTGVFQADFSSFFDAVKQSELHLKELTGDAAKAESGLSRMADSFSGRKIIQDATQMAEVFDRAGGSAGFTEKELARMGATGQEAIAKLKALGADVPPGIQRIADAATNAANEQKKMLDSIGASGGRLTEFGTAAGTTTGKMSGLSDSYRQFDGVLQAAGVNIGPQVKGLEDIANAAGKTSKEIGLLGTAGLAAGAFMTGWKIGTWIDEMTGASTAVENLARSLMGLEPAMTKVEQEQLLINKAIDQGAPITIKYKDALKFLEEQKKKNADAAIDWRMKLADAHKEIRGLSDATKESIAIAIEAGATTEQITNKYHISADGLRVLKETTDAAADAQARLAAEAKSAADALEKQYAKLMSDTKNANQLAIMENDAAKLKIENDQKKWESTVKVRDAILASAAASSEAAKFEQNLTAEQANVEKENQKLIASFTDLGKAQTEAGAAGAEAGATTVAAFAGVSQQIELTSDGVRGWIELMKFTNRANAILKENSLFTTSGQLERIAAGDTGGSLSAFNPPGFAGGVENFGGGLAKVHGGEVLMNLPRGTSVIPKGGLGANISNVFNLVDSESNLARRVSEVIMRQIRAGTQLGTA